MLESNFISQSPEYFAQLPPKYIAGPYLEKQTAKKQEAFLKSKDIRVPDQLIYDESFLKKAVIVDAGWSVFQFIAEQIDLTRADNTLLYLKRRFIFKQNHTTQIRNVINLKPINQYESVNSYFRSVNALLPDAGIYIGCYEDYTARQKRICRKYPSYLHKVILFFDFITNRVLPRLAYTRRIHSLFSREQNKAISKAEALGRLCHAGFEIITDEKIDGLSYFSVMKVRKPKNDLHASYNLVFKMNRIGKDGKEIGIYKIRTMHPYSEYLQEYIIKMNGYCNAGKPKDDFRVTNWSRVIRKYHLDELPQIINILKGELNIVGVRPLSKFGFESLPLDLQRERIKYKSGWIPPNVSLGLKGFYGVMWAERLYLRQLKKKSAFTTNFKFFFMAVYNMIGRKHDSA